MILLLYGVCKNYDTLHGVRGGIVILLLWCLYDTLVAEVGL